MYVKRISTNFERQRGVKLNTSKKIIERLVLNFKKESELESNIEKLILLDEIRYEIETISDIIYPEHRIVNSIVKNEIKGLINYTGSFKCQFDGEKFVITDIDEPFSNEQIKKLLDYLRKNHYKKGIQGDKHNYRFWNDGDKTAYGILDDLRKVI